MKRTEALVLLSRDHHQALVIAQRLRRADTATASAARRALLDYWDAHGRIHFQREEELLLPAYAGYGDAHGPLVAACCATTSPSATTSKSSAPGRGPSIRCAASAPSWQTTSGSKSESSSH